MSEPAPVDSDPPGRDGRSTRWDRHRRERRLTIIGAAVTAIEEYGPDVRTAQIAQQAGVPRTHVYRHFDGKPALELAVFATELTAVIQSYLRAFGVDTPPAERVIVGVVGLVDATAAWWLERHDVARAELGAELSEQVWLLIQRAAHRLGLALDPDRLLPDPNPAAGGH